LDSRIGSRRARAVPLLAACGLLVLPYTLFQLLLPGIMSAPSEQARFFSLFSLGALAGAAAAMFWSVVLRRTALLRVLIGGSGVLLCLNAVLPLETCVPFVAFPLGALTTAGGLGAVSALAHLYPELPRRTASLIFAIHAFASMVFPVIVVALTWAVSNDAHAALTAGLCAVSALLLCNAAWLRADKEPEAVVVQVTEFPRSHVGLLVVGGLLGTLHAATDNLIAQWAMLYFTQSYPSADLPPALILSLCAFAYFATRLALARLPERWGEIPLLILPGAFGAAALWMGFTSTNYLSAATWHVIATLCFGLEYPALMGFIGRRTSGSSAPVIAASTLGCYAVSSLLNPLLGSIATVENSARAAMMWLPLGFVAFSAVAAMTVLWLASAKCKPKAMLGAAET